MAEIYMSAALTLSALSVENNAKGLSAATSLQSSLATLNFSEREKARCVSPTPPPNEERV
jgi:hypothetical protein